MAFIFPNRRAVQVFKNHLTDLTEKPIWTPRMISIDDWMAQVSGLSEADKITQLLNLYEAVQGKDGQKEGVDQFIRWGEMLLRDFDEIDKYLVEPEKIFRTILSVKEIEAQFPSLGPEQLEQLQKFWSGFHPTPSSFQEKWLHLWNSLENIYQDFHDILTRQKLATSGYIYRSSCYKIEKDPSASLPLEKYFFIGFNALSAVEERVFTICKQEGKASFYWDIPANLMDSYQESGHFIRANVRKFPPPETFTNEFHRLQDRFGKIFPAQFEPVDIYACESASGQVGILRQILSTGPIEQLSSGKSQKAVILADETLLEPVLSAISNPGTEINISMGFPADRSLFVDFIRRIIEINTYLPAEKSGKIFLPTSQLSQLLHHPVMASLLSDDMNSGFDLLKDWPASMVPLDLILKKEPEISLFLCFQDVGRLINKLISLFDRFKLTLETQPALEKESFQRIRDWIITILQGLELKKLKINLDSFIWLFNDFIQKERLPFEGSLSAGIQLTGILETRLMDYDELIILSCNEGIWPADSSPPTLIPYNLRRANNLPTREYRDSFYGYYFYRLLQRARKVSLMYVNSPDPAKMSQGDPSRFIQQLRFDSNQFCREFLSASSLNPGVSPARIILKSGAVREALNSYLDKSSGKYLSPSALNTYIDCPLRFSMQYLLRIREGEDLVEAGEPRMFGQLMHKTLEYLYQDFAESGKFVQIEYLKNILQNNEELNKYIRQAFKSEYFKLDPDSAWPELFGKDLLVQEVLSKQFRSVLMVDVQYTPFKIIGLEKKVSATVRFEMGGKPMEVLIGGYIDRLDEKDGLIRILDYKSGNPGMAFKDIQDLVNPLKQKRQKEILQALIYSVLFLKGQSTYKAIQPAIYPTGKMRKKPFEPGIIHDKDVIQDILDYSDGLLELLRGVLADIFNPDLDFKQTENETTCRFCPFKDYCRR